MGCGASKVDDLPMVSLCRERKEFLKAASEQRYALALRPTSHIFALRATLPSDEGKGNMTKLKKKNLNSSSSTSISHLAHDNSPGQEEIYRYMASGNKGEDGGVKEEAKSGSSIGWPGDDDRGGEEQSGQASEDTCNMMEKKGGFS
ncbi:hypothetical protein K1719_000755 [Acacia pycnantha]|nr:hypothetical protein K1719_000755 [Acacia pycnantha]